MGVVFRDFLLQHKAEGLTERGSSCDTRGSSMIQLHDPTPRSKTTILTYDPGGRSRQGIMYIMALVLDRFGPSWSTHAAIGHPKIAIAPRYSSISDALVSCLQDKPYDYQTTLGLSLHFRTSTVHMHLLYLKVGK